MINLPENLQLSDHRLIIPSTCVGNVSQLTCDLLIESLQMYKIGDCFHSAIIPMIGGSAFSHIKDPITTAAELFHDSKTRLLVLQLRTPLAAPLMADFFEKLLKFVQLQGIREVSVLTSSYGYEKREVMGSNFWCKANGVTVPASIPESTEAKILGGGFGLRLYEKLVEAKVPTLLLYKFVSEGDNIPDAVGLLQKLNESVRIFNENEELKVQMPVSWKYLFGNAPPKELY